MDDRRVLGWLGYYGYGIDSICHFNCRIDTSSITAMFAHGDHDTTSTACAFLGSCP
jgi:hypothetical protein